jgi:hypothetical protein
MLAFAAERAVEQFAVVATPAGIVTHQHAPRPS